jgi:hypothetical protein
MYLRQARGFRLKNHFQIDLSCCLGRRADRGVNALCCGAQVARSALRSRRRQKADHPPGDHHAPAADAGGARRARHQRRNGAALLRPRARRRPGRGSAGRAEGRVGLAPLALMVVAAPSPLEGEGMQCISTRHAWVRGLRRDPSPNLLCGFFLEPSPSRGEGARREIRARCCSNCNES